jgi:hypothetical protein
MTYQIVNIRGCNGSGKTHAVRTFLDRLPCEPLGGKKGKPAGYVVDATSWGISTPIYVIGSYETTCGGGDTISSQEEIVKRVKQAYEYGHVLVEGLLMSKSSAGGVVAPALKELGAIFAFLDTPWETCLSRVLSRRKEAGNEKEFDPEKNMRSAYEQCHRSYELLSIAGGYDVRWLDHEDAVGTVVEYFKRAENGQL